MCFCFVCLLFFLYFSFFFFFNDTATTEIYTLSLHDALPVCAVAFWLKRAARTTRTKGTLHDGMDFPDAGAEKKADSDSRAAAYPRRIKSGAFFRERTPPEAVLSGSLCAPTGIEMSPRAYPCPLSAQPDLKTDAQNPQVNR